MVDEKQAEGGQVQAVVSPPVEEITHAPIPYEQEKAMRLFMKLCPTGKELRLPGGNEVNIIQRAIEEVVRDLKDDCKALHEADVADINRLKENENTLLRAIENACHAWNIGWDCSRTPGHPELEEAINNLSGAHQEVMRNAPNR